MSLALENGCLEVFETGLTCQFVYAADVFNRFARLDDARSSDAGGSGIGLAIVKQVAELHGGTAIVTDSALGGACFTIAIPVSVSPSPGEGRIPS